MDGQVVECIPGRGRELVVIDAAEEAPLVVLGVGPVADAALGAWVHEPDLHAVQVLVEGDRGGPGEGDGEEGQAPAADTARVVRSKPPTPQRTVQDGTGL